MWAYKYPFISLEMTNHEIHSSSHGFDLNTNSRILSLSIHSKSENNKSNIVSKLLFYKESRVSPHSSLLYLGDTQRKSVVRSRDTRRRRSRRTRHNRIKGKILYSIFGHVYNCVQNLFSCLRTIFYVR